MRLYRGEIECPVRLQQNGQIRTSIKADAKPPGGDIAPDGITERWPGTVFRFSWQTAKKRRRTGSDRRAGRRTWK